MVQNNVQIVEQTCVLTLGDSHRRMKIACFEDLIEIDVIQDL